MKLRKIEQKLEGDQYWPKLKLVKVEGDREAKPLPEGASQPDAEDIIRTWNKAVVLRAIPADGGAMIGFLPEGSNRAQYLNMPIETTEGGLFAMRLGPNNINFFVVPKDHKTNYELEVIAITAIDDSQYKQVPLY